MKWNTELNCCGYIFGWHAQNVFIRISWCWCRENNGSLLTTP